MKEFRLIFAFVILSLCGTSLASVDIEMEGMESVSRGDGTFLVAGPTYQFDRILGAGGMHSESELWSPQKIRQRLLFNRFSILPSWEPLAPSVWVKTGNELGDMIYQDLITNDERPANRTPILEGGFRTPNFHGFWVTARGFQDDHYSTGTSPRRKMVDSEFSHFGENYPLFSSIYGGLGYTDKFISTSILVGEEYIWEYMESSRWIPVHFKPRIDGRVDIWNMSIITAYEDAEYQNKAFNEKGSRKELNGSIVYNCNEKCRKGIVQLSAGLQYRAVSDSGSVYTGLENDVVIWPFAELRVDASRFLRADVTFGMNDRDWLVEDSVEIRSPQVIKNFGSVIGVKNISGSRLNPIADDKEFFTYSEVSDTIDLSPSGSMHLVQAYLSFEDTLGAISIGGRASVWTEYGAETFDTTGFVSDGGYYYRYGDVGRINSWIKGVTGELWINTWLEDWFKFETRAGFERIDGLDRGVEVTPSEFFLQFGGDWLIRKSFRVSHSIRYRSDAEWNLRSRDPFVIKGDWYWDATFEQRFPKIGLSLSGSLIHVLADEVVQVPNGGYDRIRFVCTARKTF